MKDSIFNTMKALNGFVSPSAHEREELEYVKKEIAPFAGEENICFDKMGNMIAVLGKGKGEKVMFSAHSDTLGFVAYFIDEKGFVKVSPLGGINTQTLRGRQVRFTNGVNGLLCFESGDLNMRTAYVDIGASSKEEAEKLISLGMAASVVGEVFRMGTENDPRIVSPFLDDRIAVAIQIEAIKKLSECANELKNEVYFVFSVQEEVGIRGASTAAFGIDPVYGVAIDVTSAADTPKCDPMNMSVGAGACIKYMDGSLICSPKMTEFMNRVAEDAGIKHQTEILLHGGTDAAAIQRTRAGVYAGGISIATRYIHTPTEEVSLADCESCVELIVALCKEGFTF